MPWAFGFSSVGDTLLKSGEFTYPLIVKPTDSAGSKGVTRVDRAEELEDAVKVCFEAFYFGKGDCGGVYRKGRLFIGYGLFFRRWGVEVCFFFRRNASMKRRQILTHLLHIVGPRL